MRTKTRHAAQGRPRRHRLEDPARAAAGRPHHQCRAVERVGISAPPCLRRVKRLEEAGIIRGYRALLNAPALGLDVVAFCLIGLNHQSEAELKAFADRTRNWPIVRQAWMVSGESDFLLHCVASDLGTFQSFVIEELTSTPNVDTVRTALTIRQVKDEGPVAI